MKRAPLRLPSRAAIALPLPLPAGAAGGGRVLAAFSPDGRRRR